MAVEFGWKAAGMMKPASPAVRFICSCRSARWEVPHRFKDNNSAFTALPRTDSEQSLLGTNFLRSLERSAPVTACQVDAQNESDQHNCIDRKEGGVGKVDLMGKSCDLECHSGKHQDQQRHPYQSSRPVVLTSHGEHQRACGEQETGEYSRV